MHEFASWHAGPRPFAEHESARCHTRAFAAVRTAYKVAENPQPDVGGAARIARARVGIPLQVAGMRLIAWLRCLRQLRGGPLGAIRERTAATFSHGLNNAKPHSRAYDF